MADSAVPTPSRSPGASSVKGRSRADVEPGPTSARADDVERDDAALSQPFDPRQGTLLGFEVPADLLVAKAEQDLPAEAAPAASMEPQSPVEGQRVTKEKEAMTERSSMDEKSVAIERSPAVEEPAVETPVTVAHPVAAEPPLASPKAESVKEVVPDEAASLAAAATDSAARVGSTRTRQAGYAPPSSTVNSAAEGSRGFDRTATSAIAMTVAALEEAFVEERGAANDRWRRTRRWLIVAVAGLAVLLVVCIGQTIALIGFAHSVQDTQAQLQSAVNQQQAALANLASAPSALAAGLQSTDGQVSAPDAASAASAAPPAPVRHARSHRHHRERQRMYAGH